MTLVQLIPSYFVKVYNITATYTTKVKPDMDGTGGNISASRLPIKVPQGGATR